jgi:hypothetical protein
MHFQSDHRTTQHDQLVRGHLAKETRAATRDRKTAGGYQVLQLNDKIQHTRLTRYKQHPKQAI